MKNFIEATNKRITTYYEEEESRKLIKYKDNLSNINAIELLLQELKGLHSSINRIEFDLSSPYDNYNNIVCLTRTSGGSFLPNYNNGSQCIFSCRDLWYHLQSAGLSVEQFKQLLIKKLNNFCY